jgi:hypothetical protein
MQYKATLDDVLGAVYLAAFFAVFAFTDINAVNGWLVAVLP